MVIGLGIRASGLVSSFELLWGVGLKAWSVQGYKSWNL